ncbi:CBS domain-containing protein [Bradyrhizobium sp. NFR13]|jgi:CBS domain-containing protein
MKLMKRHRIKRILIARDLRLIGIVSRRDLLRGAVDASSV